MVFLHQPFIYVLDNNSVNYVIYRNTTWANRIVNNNAMDSI